MLNPQIVANYLQEQLNNYGQESKYTFVIYAEIGKPQNSSAISGIVKSADNPPLSPIENYTEVKYSFRVELIVPAAGANAHYIAINNIVGQMTEAQNGASVSFGNGNGIVTFSATKPEKYDIAYGAGSVAPIEFMVYVVYTEQASTVTSSDKIWMFDNVVIPYLSESVTVETEGVTRKIFSEQYSKLLKTGQQRFYTFEIPQTSEIGATFQALILNNNITENPVHTLSYTDGITYTSDSPFVTNVVLYRSGNEKTERPGVSRLTITFTDADNPQNTVYPAYYIGLLDFPYDNQSEDTMYFGTQEAQQSYFTEALLNGAQLDRISAPNLNSIDITKQIYPNTRNYSMLDLAKKNYAVIQYIESEESSPEYLYYFVTDCQIGAGGQIVFDLHLDTVQTYFFAPNVSFANCLIERAHLNRFQAVEGQPDYVQFVTDPATKIYNAEDALNYPKRLIKRTRIELAPIGVEEIDTWLSENVDYWVYVYLDSSHDFNVYTPYSNTAIQGTTTLFKSEIRNDPINPTAVYYYPVYKKDRTNQNIFINIKSTWSIILSNQTHTGTTISRVSEDSRKYFEEVNTSYASYYYSIKASILPPFLFRDTDMTQDFSINSRGDLEINMDIRFVTNNLRPFYYQSNVANGIITSFGNDDDQAKYALFTGIFQYDYYTETESYALPYNANILISDIKNGTDRLSYNPKLNGQNFRELVITSSSGDSFTYDIQKLQNDNVTFIYTEPFSPEITKYYMRVNAPCGLYEQGTESNYMGLVGSTDTSIAFVNDQYAAFLANNKNFWMQSNMKIVTGLVKSSINVAANMASGKTGEAVTGGVGAGIDAVTSIIDRNMTVDNMKQAPDQLKNANGNLIFNILVTGLGLYVEEFAALDGDLQTAFDFMELYGFSVNAIGNIKDYVNIRKYHNYVKAQLQAVTGEMSNIAKTDLRQRFANGIRFWNIETPDYTKENYENWLDE